MIVCGENKNYLLYRKCYLPYRKRYLLHRKRNLNGRGAPPEAGLPSPSSLRDATSPKVRGLGSPPSLQFGTLRPAAARGDVRRYAQTSRLCQGLSLWESWTPLGGLRGRGCWRGDFAPVLLTLTMGQTSESLNLNGRSAPPEAGLPSPSSLRDATSPKVRGFGCTGKFAFSKKLPLWGSWREAPERARTLPGETSPRFSLSK